MKVFEAYDPRAYLDAIDKLAWFMWHDSGCPPGTDRMRFWLPAEKHILALAAATVAAAQTADQAATAFDEKIRRFNPGDYLERIRVAAYFIWKKRGGSPVWDPSQAIEDWTESEKHILDQVST